MALKDFEQKIKISEDLVKEVKCDYLREISSDDCQLLFEWVNDSEVRKNSFSREPIPYETHVLWFQKKLEDSGCEIFIYMDGNEPVGQVRVDFEEDAGLISYFIAKEFRGKGYGKKMLLAIETKIAERVGVLNAQVKKDNKASQLVFERLGYQRMEKEDMVSYKKYLV